MYASFMDATTDIFAQALAKAKTDLAALEVDFNRLVLRKSQLEAFITNAEPLVPTSTHTVASAPLPYRKPTNVPAVPIWKSIVQSINGKGDSFSVNDALDGLIRIGRPIGSPNRVQIVRNVLMTKIENFEQVAPGRFKVIRGGVQEKEVASEEGTS